MANPDLAIAENEAVNIYPNPATNVLNINLPNDEAILLIYDLTGRLVLEQSLAIGTNVIDVKSLNSSI